MDIEHLIMRTKFELLQGITYLFHIPLKYHIEIDYAFFRIMSPILKLVKSQKTKMLEAEISGALQYIKYLHDKVIVEKALKPSP